MISAAPFAVVDFKAQLRDNGSISLSWVKPTVLNGPLDGYTIELFKPSEKTATLQTYDLDPTALDYELFETEKSTV